MNRVAALVMVGACIALTQAMPVRAEPLASVPPEASSEAEKAATKHDEAPESAKQKPLEDASVTLARVLEDRRYAFCHDRERPVEDDYRYCQYAHRHVAECPAFEAACAKSDPAPDDERSDFELNLSPALAAVARVVFWTLLVVVVAWWFFGVAKHLYDSRSDVDPEGERPAPLPAEAEEEGPRSGRVVDKDALRLLARSRKALAEGDLRGAVRSAHAALVRALEAAGHLHVERSSTNGDYQRALRQLPELGETFRKVAGEVERSEFGKTPPSSERLEQILALVEPIVRGIALIALFAIALSMTACRSSGAWERPEDGPGGNSVFHELLKQRGATVGRRSNPVDELPEENTDTVVVMSSAPLTEADWLTLVGWVEASGVLVVAGRRFDLPDKLGVKDRMLPDCVEKPTAAPMGKSFEASEVVFGGAPLALDPEWAPQVTCGGAPVVASRALGNGTVVLLGDAHFLSNASLATGDHAHVAMELIGRPTSVSQIDRRVAAGTDTPYRAMAQSGLLPALVQGLFLMLLVALARGASFGIRRELVVPPRRAFAEHVMAVGRLYAKSGASRHALGAYAAWALERLHARRGPAGDTRVLDSAGFVAQTTGQDERAVTRVLAEAADARERPDLPSSLEEDRATFVALDELVQKTGGMK